MSYGCLLADGENSPIGVYNPTGNREQTDDILVAVAAGAASDWQQPYVSVVFTLPRDANVPEKYMSEQEQPSASHRVEFKIQGDKFSLKAAKHLSESMADAYEVRMTGVEPLVSGHPWPFRPKTPAAACFFFEGV